MVLSTKAENNVNNEEAVSRIRTTRKPTGKIKKRRLKLMVHMRKKGQENLRQDKD